MYYSSNSINDEDSQSLDLIAPNASIWMALNMLVMSRTFSHIEQSASNWVDCRSEREDSVTARVKSIVLFLMCTIVVGNPSNIRGQQRYLWQAQVVSDHAKVFTEVAAGSDVVMQLKKGNVVSVVLEISVSGDKWCRIALPDQAEPSGYTLCKELKQLRSAARQEVQPEPVILSHRQTSAVPERAMEKTPSRVGMLTNKDILELMGAGLRDDVLIAKIKSSACDFDTAPATLKELKAGGVPDAVILAMVEIPTGPTKLPSVAAAAAAETTNPVPAKSSPTPSDGKTRVLVTDSQSWESRGGSSGGGNRNGWGGSSWFAGGARPQTAEIIKTLNERCPQITVTNRLDKADFVVTLDHEGGKALLQRHNKIAVFNRDGDVVFSKSTISLGNSVKDACQVMLGASR